MPIDGDEARRSPSAGSSPSRRRRARAARPARRRRRGARRPCRRASPTRPCARGSLRVSTATRASSPIRPGQHGVREQPDGERREDERRRRVRRLHRLTGSRSSTRARARRPTARLSAIATTTHCHSTAANASPIAVKLGPRQRKSATTTARSGSRAAPCRARSSAGERAAASRCDRRVAHARRSPLVDRDRGAARSRPTSSAPARARRPATPIACRLGSSASSASTASTSAAPSPAGNDDAGLGRHHVAVAGDVGRDDRRRARERARQHHAEALAAERRRDERLRREQLLGEALLVEEAEHLDAVVGHAQPRHQQPHAQRIGADDAQRRAGAAADLRPGLEQDLQALALLVPAGEDDAVLAVGGIGAGGMSTPFGMIS